MPDPVSFDPVVAVARHVLRLLTRAADRDPADRRLLPGESVLVEPIMGGPPKK